MKGSTKGVYIIKELGKNTCEWIRIQQADIKVALPKAIMDSMIKSHLGWANEVQEKFKRNGKAVDR